MKNKIIALILSALILTACLTVSVCAAPAEPARISSISGIFTLRCPAELSGKNIEFNMQTEELPEVTVEYFETLFDEGKYDASFYCAYKASLEIDGASHAFTEDMSVEINLGDAYAEKEVFLLYIKSDNTPSGKVSSVREGAVLRIGGKDFREMADKIIIVMTADPVTQAPVSPLVPSIVCAVIAVAAIAATVIIVKKKNDSDSIVK